MVPFFVACSTDDSEMDDSTFNILELNATYEVDGCTVTTFDFNALGYIEIKNDRDSLYVTIIAESDNTISATSLHIANTFSDFPTVGKGNLQAHRMDYQESFEDEVIEYSFHFPLDVLDESLVIASYTTFNGSEAVWAGDLNVKQGNWSYFDYQVKEHPFNAGPDASRTMTVSEAAALPSWDEVRKVYAGMLAPGVDKKSGTYSPSIWDLINDFNDPDRESKVGEYATTYTLGSGECTDSVELIMIVVPDQESLQ